MEIHQLDDHMPASRSSHGSSECGHSTEGTSMQNDGWKTGDETGPMPKSGNCGCSSSGTPNTSPDGFRYIADAAWGLLENAHQNVYDDQGRYGYWVHDGDVCALLDELRLFDPGHEFQPRNPNPPMRVEFGEEEDLAVTAAVLDQALGGVISIGLGAVSGATVVGLIWLASSLFGG